MGPLCTHSIAGSRPITSTAGPWHITSQTGSRPLTLDRRGPADERRRPVVSVSAGDGPSSVADEGFEPSKAVPADLQLAHGRDSPSRIIPATHGSCRSQIQSRRGGYLDHTAGPRASVVNRLAVTRRGAPSRGQISFESCRGHKRQQAQHLTADPVIMRLRLDRGAPRDRDNRYATDTEPRQECDGAVCLACAFWLRTVRTPRVCAFSIRTVRIARVRVRAFVFVPYGPPARASRARARFGESSVTRNRRADLCPRTSWTAYPSRTSRL